RIGALSDAIARAHKPLSVRSPLVGVAEIGLGGGFLNVANVGIAHCARRELFYDVELFCRNDYLWKLRRKAADHLRSDGERSDGQDMADDNAVPAAVERAARYYA